MRRVVFLVPVLAMSLVACSGSKSNPAASSSKPPVSAAASTTSAAPGSSAPVSTVPATTAAPTSAVASVVPSVAASTAPSVGAPSSAPAPTSAAATTSAAPAKPDVKKQVIALTDLPAGWLRDTAGSGSDAGDPACFKAVDDKKDKPAARAQVNYKASAEGLPAVQEQVAYEPKKSVAALTRAKNALDKCGAISLVTNGTTLKGSMSPMSFPTVGDASAAYQLVLSGVVTNTRVTVGFDLLLFRVGDEDVALFYTSLGAPLLTEFEAVAKLAVGKIQGAGGTLS